MKKKSNKGYSKKKKREVEAKVRELIGKDFSDYEIQEAMNLQPHVLRHYKKKIYEKDRVLFANLTPESVLSDYARKAKECVTQLEALKEVGRESGEMSQAHVQAIKVQHRIENQVIKHAQNLGLLSKRGTNINVDKINFQKNSMKDIKAAVQVEADGMVDWLFE